MARASKALLSDRLPLISWARDGKETAKVGKEKTMKVILLILAKFLSCKVDIIVEVFICIQTYSKISSRC